MGTLEFCIEGFLGLIANAPRAVIPWVSVILMLMRSN